MERRGVGFSSGRRGGGQQSQFVLAGTDCGTLPYCSEYVWWREVPCVLDCTFWLCPELYLSSGFFCQLWDFLSVFEVSLKL